jgi:hypothetical protein
VPLSYHHSLTVCVNALHDHFLLYFPSGSKSSKIENRHDSKCHFNITSFFRLVNDQHAELDFYSVSSLKQQFAGRHVAPLGHIILVSSHQSLLLLLGGAYLTEKQHISIVFGYRTSFLCGNRNGHHNTT